MLEYFIIHEEEKLLKIMMAFLISLLLLLLLLLFQNIINKLLFSYQTENFKFFLLELFWLDIEMVFEAFVV